MVDGVRKRGDRWQARPYVNGKYHWAGTWNTRAEAKEAARKKRAEVLAAEGRDGTDLTFSEAHERYERDHLQFKAESTKLNAKRYIEAFCTEFGEEVACNFTWSRGQEWARTRTRAMVDPVSTWLNWCAHPRQDIIPRNPLAGVEVAPTQAQEKYVPSVEEVYALADAALEAIPGIMGPRIRALILFTAGCGERAGEVTEITWGDVDFEQSLVTLRYAACPVTNERKETKGKQESVIALTAMAREALESIPRGLPDTLIFTLTDGNKMSKSKRYYWWDKVRQRAALPGNVRFHDLRHHAATRMVEAGVPDWATAKQLTHKDGGKLVRMRYAHPSTNAAIAAILAADAAAPPSAPTPDATQTHGGTQAA